MALTRFVRITSYSQFSSNIGSAIVASYSCAFYFSQTVAVRFYLALKRPKPEEIVTKLPQVEVQTGQVMQRLDVIRQIGVTEQIFYRWKKKHGGVGTDQLKKLKRLQKEIERLRKAVSDLMQGKLIRAEAAKGNF